ncbi:heavy metal-responsive transcriptional regulator [Colwellia sp. MSW7]|uniref:Heavy metal-responsive transcriptional regulator n=1 Tax=Colwellia maritima TaxID=2912588 RepID=A0ABS9X5P2_9GAMM|nr:heavy metal-responsive transcriptional regulator [Colwellia maritima]MCI2285539.1 heavy metal-responsive transcriptional regulator [Colwellia maritima]
MTIGKLANAVGISVETIRFYQRQGLVTQPEKPLNGFRQYPASTISRLKFIINAKGLGFTLNEIRSLDDLSYGCRAFHNMATSKLDDIRNEISHLQAIEKKLMNIIDCCSPDCKEERCAVIEKMHY